MKHQYFGDINDYRKYGLLRALSEASGLRLGVLWLLTEDDGRNDGEYRGYLSLPGLWRGYDPSLYEGLQKLAHPVVRRSVHNAGEWGLLPGAYFFGPMLEDSRAARDSYFQHGFTALANCPLLFFDPDNGLEVISVPRGRKNSNKYLYWREVEEPYSRGHSCVIYQHFRREPRAAFANRLAQEATTRLGAPLVDSFATAHVLFLLFARPEHTEGFRRAHDLVLERWKGQIRPLAHSAAT